MWNIYHKISFKAINKLTVYSTVYTHVHSVATTFLIHVSYIIRECQQITFVMQLNRFWALKGGICWKRKNCDENHLKCKRGCIFHLIFVGVCPPSILILPIIGVLLNGKNLLSITKVICRQSLNYQYIWLYVNL